MNLSAKHFQGPLLRTLAKLSNWTAGVEIKGEDTYDGILALMGITSLDEHGTNDSSGQPQVVKWIQWANINTRKAGQTEMVGRGKWTLTAAGLDEAIRLAKMAGETIPDPAAVVTPPPAPVTAPAVKPALVVVPKGDESFYHPDAYVRKLAIDQTGCFGNVSPHGASVCTDCPLRLECRNRQIAEFSKLARMILAEEKAPVVKPANPNNPVAPKAAAAAPTGPSGRFANIDFSKADVIKNKAESLCAECGQPIARDERCRWVESLPNSSDGAVFHLDCSGGEE